MIGKITTGLLLVAAMPVLAADVIPDNGPFVGGNTVLVTNAVPDIGAGDITNIVVGGVGTTAITGQGSNWVLFTAPSVGVTGAQDVVVQSMSAGATTLTDAYTVNPAGVIGGNTPDWDRWEEVAGTPVMRTYMACGVLGDYLYWVGGYNSGAQTNVYRFNGTSWSEVRGLPTGQYGHTVGVVSGALYSIGGWNGAALTNVCRFNGTTWTQVRGLPESRNHAACGVLNDSLYVIGGSDGSSNQTNVWRYTGADWANVRGVPVSMSGMECDRLNESLYLVGSLTSVTNVYRFNGTSWSLVAGLPFARRYVSAAALEDGLYALGGNSNTVTCSDVFRYDGSTWTEVTPLPTARESHASCVYSGQVYVVGGSSKTNVYRYPVLLPYFGVSPSNGYAMGGFDVTIRGSHLGSGTDITNVTLCGVNASIVSQSATQVVVTAAKSLTAGTGAVRVYSIGYAVTELSDGFTYTGSSRIAQSIAFDPIPGQRTGDVVRLSATASSGLHVSFAVTNGPGVIANATNLSFTGVGEVSVVASQAGDYDYEPADDVIRSFAVIDYSAFSFRATALTNQVVLRWLDPMKAGFSNHTAHVRFDTTTYPEFTNSGTGLYTGTNQVYTHEGLVSGQPYYYTIWCSHDASNFVAPDE